MPIDPATIGLYIITLFSLFVIQLILPILKKPRQRFKDAREGPRCQGCGYILYGQLPQICPECGRDANLDVQPPPPQPMPPIAGIIALWVTLFPLTIAAGYPIAALFPQTWRGEATQIIPTPAGDVRILADARGRGWKREIRSEMVVIPNAKGRPVCRANLVDMTITAHNRAPVSINRAGILSLLSSKANPTDPATIAAADQIVNELQSLRANKWPDDRFSYERTGHYAIDPDDNFGPFFWLPTYAPACIPVWLLLSFTISRRILKSYRAAKDAIASSNDVTSIAR